MQPSQSIPQTPPNSSDAPAEQVSMRNPNTRRKDKQTSPYLRLHEVAETPGQKMTLWQERRTCHQNSTKNATPKRQTLFALTSSLSWASPRPKVPSASALQDISLMQNFLWVSASRLSPACDEKVACPYSRRNRPRSGLRIFGTPCHTSHPTYPTLETARAPLLAKPAPSALLA